MAEKVKEEKAKKVARRYFHYWDKSSDWACGRVVFWKKELVSETTVQGAEITRLGGYDVLVTDPRFWNERDYKKRGSAFFNPATKEWFPEYLFFPFDLEALQKANASLGLLDEEDMIEAQSLFIHQAGGQVIDKTGFKHTVNPEGALNEGVNPEVTPLFQTHIKGVCFLEVPYTDEPPELLWKGHKVKSYDPLDFAEPKKVKKPLLMSREDQEKLRDQRFVKAK